MGATKFRNRIKAQRPEIVVKPDYIIPFVKTKEDAIAQMKKFYRGKWLLPSNYASASRLEKVQGMYVPFWLFDASVEGHAQFSASNYRSRSVSTWHGCKRSVRALITGISDH